MQENKISGKSMPWMIMSMEKCLPGGKNGRIEYLEEKIWEINVVQPLKSHWNHAQMNNRQPWQLKKKESGGRFGATS